MKTNAKRKYSEIHERRKEKEKLIMDALDEENKAKRRRMISDKRKIEIGKAYRKRITGSYSYSALHLRWLHGCSMRREGKGKGMEGEKREEMRSEVK